MVFSVHKKDLIILLQKVYPIVPSGTSLQVLTNLKIKVSQGYITVYASDLDNFVESSIKVDTTEEAEIALDARKFFEIVRGIGEDIMHITIDNNTLEISDDSGFKCSITGVGLREFPHFPDTDFTEKHTLSPAVFTSLYNKSSFAVSKDDSRGCLCGILWELSKKRTGMVATDGHRLGARFIDTHIEMEHSIIVPPKSLKHIISVFDLEEAEELQFSLQDKYIIFYLDNFILSTKLIKGPYPDYEKGIPKEFSKTALVDKSIFLESIKRVSLLSSNKNQLVKVFFEDGIMNISTDNRDIGGFAEQNIPIEYEGDESLTIGFNSKYLQDIISAVESKKVKIKMNNHIKAVVLVPEYESEKEADIPGDDIFLIMPLKIFE
ncbi:MAG: DNA polymerase III subunit beta [Fibrobacterota bacterium]